MAEEIKNNILNFLKENEGKKFSVLGLKKEINIAYNTAMKWVMVLCAEPESGVNVDDHGCLKLIYYLSENPDGKNTSSNKTG